MRLIRATARSYLEPNPEGMTAIRSRPPADPLNGRPLEMPNAVPAVSEIAARTITRRTQVLMTPDLQASSLTLITAQILGRYGKRPVTPRQRAATGSASEPASVRCEVRAGGFPNPRAT